MGAWNNSSILTVLVLVTESSRHLMLHVETLHAQIVEDRLGSDTNAVLNEIGKIQQAMTFGPETGKLCQFCWKLSCFFWYSMTWNCSHLSPWANTVCSCFHTFLKESGFCPDRGWRWFLGTGAISCRCVLSFRFDEGTQCSIWQKCPKAGSSQRILLPDRCCWATGEDGSDRSQDASVRKEEGETTTQRVDKEKIRSERQSGSKAPCLPHPWFQWSRSIEAKSQAGFDQTTIQCLWLLSWRRTFSEDRQKLHLRLPEPDCGLPQCNVDCSRCWSQWRSCHHRLSSNLHRCGKPLLHLFCLGGFHPLHGIWREVSLLARPLVCLRLSFGRFASKFMFLLFFYSSFDHYKWYFFLCPDLQRSFSWS